MEEKGVEAHRAVPWLLADRTTGCGRQQVTMLMMHPSRPEKFRAKGVTAELGKRNLGPQCHIA